MYIINTIKEWSEIFGAQSHEDIFYSVLCASDQVILVIEEHTMFLKLVH